MKVHKSWVIDEELIEKIIKEREKLDRSESFVVNKIIKEHYEKQKKSN